MSSVLGFFLAILLGTCSSILLLDKLKQTNKTILCFGDSLTHGMVVPSADDWRRTHPYTLRLADLVGNYTSVLTKEKIPVGVIEKGVNGELVDKMVHRMPHVLKSHPEVGVAVILGGTNDLGSKHSADKILTNIVKVHRTVMMHNVPSIAMTIPQVQWPINNSARLEVNEGIRDFVKHYEGKVYLVEMESAFDQKVPENKKYWSVDFAHFSSQGYDAIAEMVFKVLAKIE